MAIGFERTNVLGLVAAVEEKSEHPIARAIVDAANNEGVEMPTVADLESVTGFGVKARSAAGCLLCRRRGGQPEQRLQPHVV